MIAPVIHLSSATSCAIIIWLNLNGASTLAFSGHQRVTQHFDLV
jgi:hypothetical protein